MDIKLVKGNLSHLPDLQVLGKQTFFETFASANTEANMRQYLETNFSVEKLKLELSDSDSEFHLAQLNTSFIGYLKINFNKAQTELKENHGLEIERIYVLKEYHGKQVGQILFNKAMEMAREKNMNYVWLGVWEKNLKAIRFYEKNGFAVFNTHVFKVGQDEQKDLMMKRKLK